MKKTFLISFALASTTAALLHYQVSRPTNIDDFEMKGEKVALVDEPSKWTLDKKHSNVGFNVNYMAIAEVSGKFTAFDGTLETTKADFSDAKINFTVDAASVNTDDPGRDGHLKKDDFFNAEQFPQLKFTSTSFKPLGDNKYELKGDLTIRDVTRPATFEVKYGGSVKDQRGNVRAGFKARTVIDRFAHGVKWDSKTPEGTLVVDKDVEVVLNIQMRKAAEQK